MIGQEDRCTYMHICRGYVDSGKATGKGDAQLRKEWSAGHMFVMFLPGFQGENPFRYLDKRPIEIPRVIQIEREGGPNKGTGEGKEEQQATIQASMTGVEDREWRMTRRTGGR